MYTGVMSFTPHPSPRGVVSWESYSCPLTGSSTLDSRPCTSPGQHNEADPDGEGTGQPALRVLRAEELSLLLAGCSPWESEPRTSPGQHSGADLVAWEQVS